MLINKVFDTERDEIVPKGEVERLRAALDAIASGKAKDPQRFAQDVLLNGATLAAGETFVNEMSPECDDAKS